MTEELVGAALKSDSNLVLILFHTVVSTPRCSKLLNQFSALVHLRAFLKCVIV